MQEVSKVNPHLPMRDFWSHLENALLQDFGALAAGWDADDQGHATRVGKKFTELIWILRKDLGKKLLVGAGKILTCFGPAHWLYKSNLPEIIIWESCLNCYFDGTHPPDQ